MNVCWRPIADIAPRLGRLLDRGHNEQSDVQRFATDGARLFKGALKPCMGELEAALVGLGPHAAGVRIHGVEPLRPLLASDGYIGAIAAKVMGAASKPVRAILFNKTPEKNWSLGWHQDRTICVKQKLEVPGFGPWTVKHGMNHVEPPFDLLARMVTLRAHLDDVPAINAPLLIAPGSHALGRIAERDIEKVVRGCGTRACIAEASDVWLYATPILHASHAASERGNRRVLQVDFAAEASGDRAELRRTTALARQPLQRGRSVTGELLPFR